MVKGCALAVLAATLFGCAARRATWKEPVEWPDKHSAQLVGQPMEAGAALAAAAAVREMVKQNPFPHLFDGCSSPEQGLDVAIFTGPTAGLYYVVLHQRFERCGGPSGRVLDWWYEYAVTPQGEVVAEAPPWGAEAPAPSSPPSPPPLEQAPPPTMPPQGTDVETPAPTQPPAPAPLPSPTPSEPGP